MPDGAVIPTPTEIVHVDAPNRFVDEQRTGPYRIWHHEHFFAALPDGGTEVHDLVTYAPPLGPLGILLNRFLIRPQLEKIFNYREAPLVRAGAAPPASPSCAPDGAPRLPGPADAQRGDRK